MEWNDRFMMLLRDAVERFHLRPHTPTDRFFLPEERDFLASIGYSEAEMHSYVREYATQGLPTPSTALLIAAERRSFFLTQLRGIPSATVARARDLPAETEAFQDIAYLPHLISKAMHKLHGALDPALMFGNEKDRNFLQEHGNIHPADFLHITFITRGDQQKIVAYVQNAMAANPPAAAPAEEAAEQPTSAEEAAPQDAPEPAEA